MTTTQLAKGLFEQIDVKTHAAHPHKVKIKTQGQSDLYVVRNTIAPDGTTGWHTHPGPSLITVTTGEIVAYDGDTCQRTVYRAPAGFVDPVTATRTCSRNETQAPAETVAVQILPKDATRRIDAPEPSNC